MKKKAFSLLECMVTLVMLMVVIAAVMSFRSYTVISAERAEDKLLAVHTAVLLGEAWKSEDGDPGFDPVVCSYETDFVIAADETAGEHGGSALPAFGGTYAGSYTIRLDDKLFLAHLFYQDYAVPAQATAGGGSVPTGLGGGTSQAGDTVSQKAGIADKPAGQANSAPGVNSLLNAAGSAGSMRSIHVIMTWQDSLGQDQMFHLPALAVVN